MDIDFVPVNTTLATNATFVSNLTTVALVLSNMSLINTTTTANMTDPKPAETFVNVTVDGATEPGIKNLTSIDTPFILTTNGTMNTTLEELFKRIDDMTPLPPFSSFNSTTDALAINNSITPTISDAITEANSMPKFVLTKSDVFEDSKEDMDDGSETESADSLDFYDDEDEVVSEPRKRPEVEPPICTFPRDVLLEIPPVSHTYVSNILHY